MTNHEQKLQQPPPGRRAHLAVVDEQGGKVGSPAPSERQEVYIAALRRGRLPHGQVMRWAKAWELAPSTVSEELAAARAVLDASREAPAAKILAHELTLQAAELADNVRRLAAQAIKAATEGGEGGLRKAKGLEVGAKMLASAASLKLKTAAELRQLHGLKPAEGALPAPAHPLLTLEALRGTR
jgi:hypothetical protein